MVFSLKNQLLRFVLLSTLLYLCWLGAYEFYLHKHTSFDSSVIHALVVASESTLHVLGYATTDYKAADGVFRQHVGIEGSVGVTIGAPCDGVVLYILFVCFVAAFPGPWKHKLWYLPLGTLSVFYINALRVVGLAIIVSINPDWLAFNHDYTFTIVVYAYVFLLWVIWVKRFSTMRHSEISTAT